MNKKLKETLNAVGLVASAFAMMAVGIACIFLLTAGFHAIFK